MINDEEYEQIARDLGIVENSLWFHNEKYYTIVIVKNKIQNLEHENGDKENLSWCSALIIHPNDTSCVDTLFYPYLIGLVTQGKITRMDK